MRTLPFASARALARGAFSAPARAAVLVADMVSNAPAIIERPQDTVPWSAASRLRCSPAIRTTKYAPTIAHSTSAAIPQIADPTSAPEAGRAE